MRNYTIEEIQAMFGQGLDCSQVVAGAFAEEIAARTGIPGGPDLDLQEKEAAVRKLLCQVSAAFGGGMLHGETCGAMTGSLMLLGLVYGNGAVGEIAQKAELAEKSAMFREQFLDRFPSTQCEKLVGHRIPEEFDAVVQEGTMMTLCPEIVNYCVTILADLL